VITDADVARLAAEHHEADDELAAARYELARLRLTPNHREDAHRAVDAAVAAARERVDRMLADAVGALALPQGVPFTMPGLADALALPDVAGELHAAIDATPAGPSTGARFSEYDRAEYDRREAELQGHVSAAEAAVNVAQSRWGAAVREQAAQPKVPQPG